MEAKDTVIALTPDEKLYLSTSEQELLQADRLRQAGKSFQAGVRVGYNAGKVDGQDTNHKEHGKKMRQARLEGINEVVNWIGRNSDLINQPEETDRTFAECRWLDQLKRWGLVKESVASKPKKRGTTADDQNG